MYQDDTLSPTPKKGLIQALMGAGMPMGGTTPFEGAKQTLGPPPSGGDRLNVLASRSGDIPSGELDKFNQQMSGFAKRDANLGMFDKAGQNSINADREQAMRSFYGSGYQGGTQGIAPGEHTPNAGPAPALDQPLATPPMADAPKAAPDYTKVGQYTSAAYAPEKFDRPWDQRSEKYQIGTILSNFDPKQGVTPEVLDALNKANIHGAKFSGGGDKLTVDNAGGYDRFGTGGTSDVVQGFKGGNGTWGAWAGEGGGMGGPTPQAAPGGGGMFGGSSISPMLQGDAQGGIQQALAGYAKPSDYLQQLLAQLKGGQ